MVTLTTTIKASTNLTVPCEDKMKRAVKFADTPINFSMNTHHHDSSLVGSLLVVVLTALDRLKEAVPTRVVVRNSCPTNQSISIYQGQLSLVYNNQNRTKNLFKYQPINQLNRLLTNPTI